MDDIIKKQEEEYYKAIGKFVVNFERCCATLRRNIILQISRNSGKINQTYIQILINKMAAEDLRSCYVSIINSSHELDDFESRILKNISTRFQNIQQIRNDFLHAEWMLGQGIFTHGLKVYRRKSKNTKLGQELLEPNISLEDIDDYSFEAFKINELFNMFEVVIGLPEDLKEGRFVRNFCFENKEAILVKNKDKERSETGFNRRQHQIIGIKGSADAGISCLARNSLDVYYLIMKDHADKSWGSLASNLKSVLSQSKLIEFNVEEILKKGTVIVFDEDTKELKLKEYDWFPNKEESIPDFNLLS